MAVLEAGRVVTDMVLSAATAVAAMQQTPAGVLGVRAVLGLPVPGLLGGVEATVLTAHGLVGLPDLGAQAHLGLLGLAARLLPLPLLPSPLLSRAHLPLLLPTASR
jgi:hypothetical protein